MTDKVEAADALRQASRVGIWSWNVDLDILTGNLDLAMIFGLEAAQVSNGLPLSAYFDRIHEGDRDFVSKLLSASLTLGEHYSTQYRVRSGSGERLVRAVGRCFGQNSHTGMIHVGVVLDVTSFITNTTVEVRKLSVLDEAAHHCLMAYNLARAHGLRSLAGTLKTALEDLGIQIASHVQ